MRRSAPLHRPLVLPRTRAAQEVARVRRHFRDVLRELRGKDVADLTSEQRLARGRLLAELEGYARRGVFPKNVDFRTRRMPYFVDAAGTRCAVAHLAESTGAAALVGRIAGSANNAFVREIEGDLEFQAWLGSVGLTAAEAARIQPSYCFVTKAEACVCTYGVSTATAVEATVVTEQASGPATAQVDAVHGNASLATVGEQIEVYTPAVVGTKLVVGVALPQASPSYGPVLQLNGNTVVTTCDLDIPTLTKENAIAALVSGDCTTGLEAQDSKWGESQCEGPASGCNVGSGAEGAMLPGAVFVAALFARRGRRARRLGAR